MAADEPKQVELRLVEAPTAEAEEAEGKEAEADQPEAPPSAEVLRRPAAPIELGAGAAIPDVAAFCTRGTGAEEEGGEGPPGDCTTWESGRVLEVRLMGPFTTDEEVSASAVPSSPTPYGSAVAPTAVALGADLCD